MAPRLFQLRALHSPAKAAFVAGLLLTLLTAAPAWAAGDLWLDANPIQPWNTPGMAIPAPTPLSNNIPRPVCRQQERAASDAAEQQIASAGWLLETYWPARQAGNLELVMALSMYDGMCRPLDFNGFVFYNGHFAGTLSPQPMKSRQDGVLTGKPELGPAHVRAEFLRYSPKDPLCCPSLPHSFVNYGIRTVNGLPALDPMSAPAALPASGGGGGAGPTPPLWAGGLLLAGALAYAVSRLRKALRAA